MVKNLKFNWEVTGRNCDANISSVEVLGHQATVYRSFDNKLWSVSVDHQGDRGFGSEEKAKAEAESRIESKISDRFLKAKSDLALFEKNNLQFS
tara:strand:+ start:832 stop:1113 length:282 start_codon:yes stop_codon:yes gene_type:complete